MFGVRCCLLTCVVVVCGSLLFLVCCCWLLPSVVVAAWCLLFVRCCLLSVVCVNNCLLWLTGAVAGCSLVGFVRCVLRAV